MTLTTRQQIARIWWAAVVMLMPLAAPLAAQQDEYRDTSISTDRPGFRDSTRIVPPGMLQVESGVRIQGDRYTGERLLVAPEPILRLGLTSRWELRASGDGHLDPLRTREPDARPGWSDAAVGVKVLLHEAHGRSPRLALITMLSMPVGTDLYSSSGYDPYVSLVWKENFAEQWGIGGTLSSASVTDGEGSRYWRRAASVALTRTLPWQMQGVIEGYVISPRPGAPGNEWAADVALARRIGEDLQLDVGLGRALRAAPETWFVTVGLSFRVGRRP